MEMDETEDATVLMDPGRTRKRTRQDARGRSGRFGVGPRRQEARTDKCKVG